MREGKMLRHQNACCRACMAQSFDEENGIMILLSSRKANEKSENE